MSEDFALVTFALFAYNQEKYIQEAIEGALAQDYPNLEIIISDDCSTDGTWEVMQRTVNDYTGSHRLVLNRNYTNLGIGAHVQSVFERAAGCLVVLAAGDDLSASNRVSAITEAWRSSGAIEAFIYSDVCPIDDESREVHWQERVYPGPHTIEAMAEGNMRVLGASVAYTKGVMSHFPPVSQEVVHEDRVLPFRALLLGGKAIYIDSKLVRYRITGGVSRDAQRTMSEYVLSSERREQRGAIDARQRLDDALFIGAPMECIRACEHTLRTHEAMQSLAVARFIQNEVAALRALMAGAAPGPVLKFYIKKRIVSLGFGGT